MLCENENQQNPIILINLPSFHEFHVYVSSLLILPFPLFAFFLSRLAKLFYFSKKFLVYERRRISTFLGIYQIVLKLIMLTGLNRFASNFSFAHFGKSQFHKVCSFFQLGFIVILNYSSFHLIFFSLSASLLLP